MARARTIAFVIFLLFPIPVAWLRAQSQTQSPSRPEPSTEEVTPEDVKRFFDPTILTSGLDYTFEFDSLPLGNQMIHRFSPFWAPNQSYFLFGDIPILRTSSRGIPSEVGVGDITFGYGAVIYEDLRRRFTTAVLNLEITAPTGDDQRNLGTGSWLVAPAGAIALNPTDRFPVYLFFRYQHSLASDLNPKIRTFELNAQTVHIFPKGFWLALEPNLTLDPKFQSFSLGFSFGRAISRHFAFSAAYTEHLKGQENFLRVFSITLSWLIGG